MKASAFFTINELNRLAVGETIQVTRLADGGYRIKTIPKLVTVRCLLILLFVLTQIFDGLTTDWLLKTMPDMVYEGNPTMQAIMASIPGGMWMVKAISVTFLCLTFRWWTWHGLTILNVAMIAIVANNFIIIANNFMIIARGY